ncbi:molybdopterin oxidoreductase [Achromatium sp. WMS3]|nr:molybdopterin oxidoreductase [Achromatium sp. WMS3]
MQKIVYREWGVDTLFYWKLLIGLGIIVALGGLSALYMEHEGHWVTGMTNLVVWGTPHMFAVFLVVAASGALNIASIGSVFGKKEYKPLARLSGLLAITLLVGGLLVLVLDLGRPDRLLVALFNNNFKSIFAWNIYLYSGFMVIVAAYLFTMMERKANFISRPVGILAFTWRLILTTGTGSIFGFMVSRQAFDSAILAPMFIVMSFAYGLAIYLLVLMFTFAQDNRVIGDNLIKRLKNLLGLFILGMLFFTAVYHLTKLYGTKYHGVEYFFLVDGGIYTLTFWLGHILVGMLLPLALMFCPRFSPSRMALAIACGLVVIGGLATMYTIIIGGQVYQLEMFPGMTVINEGYGAEVAKYAKYCPTVPEFLLGIGGMGVALLATTIGIRVLKFLPETLADESVS